MRTTGALHLGHYVGALKQWKEVQDSGEYECFFLLADIQALTTHADQPALLRQSVRDVTLDWLAVGLDPTRPNVHFVLQSKVVGRADLSLLFQMISTEGEVKRNPTLKAELKNVKSPTMGFLTYPIDQVADIQMVAPVPYQPGDELLVPVGEDQVPHLEYTRVLARRFNKKYGRVFLPCRALVGEVGRLVGIDGKDKMSKSLGNAIYLSDGAKVVAEQVRRMYTDPARIRPDIPGETENNPVFAYHRAFNPNVEEVKDLTRRYQQGKVGDVEVKEKLARALNTFLDPIRERRARFEQETDLGAILEQGTKAASEACQQVLTLAHEKMFLGYPR